PVCLTDYHVRNNPFRKHRGTSVELFLNPEQDPALEEPRYLDTWAIENLKLLELAEIKNPDRALFDYRLEALEDYDRLRRTGAFGEKPYRLLFGAQLPVYAPIESLESIGGEYHPLLGYKLKLRT